MQRSQACHQPPFVEPREQPSPRVVCRLSSGSAEADSGLVRHGGDLLGPQGRRELAKHAWQAPGRHDRHTLHDHPAPWDAGAMDGHDRHHHHARVGQDLGGLVGLERHRPQGRGEGVAAMPEPPGGVELQAAPILLGVDHEEGDGLSGGAG
jgi:hypothetical protein